MECHKTTKEYAERCRSTLRGMMWLSTPLVFLYSCAGYLVANLCTVVRVFLITLLIVELLIMYVRHDQLVQNLKWRKKLVQPPFWKRCLLRLGLFAIAVLLYGLIFNPIIPLYIKGLLASGYYLMLMVCWYRKTKEPKE